MSNIRLRSRILQIIDVFGETIGAVPIQLLYYHVNHQEKFPGSDYSHEEILDELMYLKNHGEVETELAYKVR